jgi:hypothetical protein
MPRFWTPQGLKESVARPALPAASEADSRVAETRVTKTPAKGRPPTAVHSAARGRSGVASAALHDDLQVGRAARSTSVPASGQKSRAAQGKAIVQILNSTPMSAAKKQRVQTQPLSTQKRSKTPAKTPARYRAGAMQPGYTSENDIYQSGHHADRAAVFKSSMKIRRTPPQQLPPAITEASAIAVAVPAGGAFASTEGSSAASVECEANVADDTTACTIATVDSSKSGLQSCNSSVQLQNKTVQAAAAVANVQVERTVVSTTATAACSDTDITTTAATKAAVTVAVVAAKVAAPVVVAATALLSDKHTEIGAGAADDETQLAAVVVDDANNTVISDECVHLTITNDDKMLIDDTATERQINHEQQQSSSAVDLINSVKHDKPFARSEKLSRTPTNITTIADVTADSTRQLNDDNDVQNSNSDNSSSSGSSKSIDDVSKAVPVVAQQQKRLSLQAAVDHHHETQYNITAQEVAKLRSDLASATQREARLVKQQKDLAKKLKHAEKHALSLGTQLSTVKLARARRESIDTTAVSTATDAIVQQLQTTVQARLTGAVNSSSSSTDTTTVTTAAAEYDRVLHELIKDVTVTTAMCTNDELAMSERQLQVSILNDAVHIKKLNDELKVQHAAAANARAITSTVGNKLAAVLKEMAKKQNSKDKASQVKYAQMQAQVVQATNDNTVLQTVHTQQLLTAAQHHADELTALKAVAQQECDQLQATATAAATAAAHALTVASQMQAVEVARVNEAKAAAANVTSIQTQTSATATATVGTSTSVSTATGSDDVSDTVDGAETGAAAADEGKVKAVTKVKGKKVKKSVTANTVTAEPELTVAAAKSTTNDDSDSQATKKKTKKKSKTAISTAIMDETILTADTTAGTDATADVTIEVIAVKASKKDKKHKKRKAAAVTSELNTTVDSDISNEMVVDTNDTDETAVVSTAATAVVTKSAIINDNDNAAIATEASVGSSKQNISSTSSRARVQRTLQHTVNASKSKYIDDTDDDNSDSDDGDSDYESKTTATTKHTTATTAKGTTAAKRSGKGAKATNDDDGNVTTTTERAGSVKGRSAAAKTSNADDTTASMVEPVTVKTAATGKASSKAATKSKSKANQHDSCDELAAAAAAANGSMTSADNITTAIATGDDAIVKQPKKKRARKQQSINDTDSSDTDAVVAVALAIEDTTAVTSGGRSKRKAATLAISKLKQASETDEQIDARLAYIAMKDKGITPTTGTTTTSNGITSSDTIDDTTAAAKASTATAAAAVECKQATAKPIAKPTNRNSFKKPTVYADESSDDSSSDSSADDDDYSNDSDTELTNTTSTTSTSKKSKANSGSAVVKPKKHVKASKATSAKAKKTAAVKAVSKERAAAVHDDSSDSDNDETVTADAFTVKPRSVAAQPVPLMDRLVQRMNANNASNNDSSASQQTTNRYAALSTVQQQHSTDDNNTENLEHKVQPAAVAQKSAVNKKATATAATAVRPVVAALVKKRKLGNSSTFNTGTLLGSLMNPKAGFKIPKLKAKA